ncbi:hypothetical protein BpHYR1_043223 [Brachionus plicatilis]|uniref:Uncharacterized protein n=1 Tax=Brachionus plicatilis TaxID=10195 RepID=A0A3M7QQN5_BRAPC|nr:hypothetical protein BpHYR1_043223 [Brachionus plicatilis]
MLFLFDKLQNSSKVILQHEFVSKKSFTTNLMNYIQSLQRKSSLGYSKTSLRRWPTRRSPMSASLIKKMNYKLFELFDFFKFVLRIGLNIRARYKKTKKKRLIFSFFPKFQSNKKFLFQKDFRL